MTNGEDGVRVRRFADRAAFLAHFLRSLAEDRAWQQWYFAEFSSLRSLPAGAAIREALLREPDSAEPALMQLARTHGLKPVTDALSSTDEELIVGCCADGAIYSANSLSRVLRLSRSASWTDARLTGWYVRIRLECPDMAASESDANDLNRDRRGGSVEFETDLGVVFLLAAVMLETPALHGVFGGPKDSALRYLLYIMCFHRGFPGAWRDPALRLAAGLADLPDTSALSAIELREIPGGLRESALPADVAYLASGDADLASGNAELLPDLALDPDTRASLAVCAAVLLRAFAGRLPALGGSSIDYLWRNVLVGDARIETATLHANPDNYGVGFQLYRQQMEQARTDEALMTVRHFTELPGCPPHSFVVRLDES